MHHAVCVPYCTTSSHTVPHYTTLYDIVPYCNTLYHILWHCTTLYHIVPHCTTLHPTAPHHATLYHIIPHYSTLYCIVPHSSTLHHIAPCRLYSAHTSWKRDKIYIYCVVLTLSGRMTGDSPLAQHYVVAPHSSWPRGDYCTFPYYSVSCRIEWEWSHHAYKSNGRWMC